MSGIALRVDGLGKQYRIGKREPYRTIRDVLTEGLANPFLGISSVFRAHMKSEARSDLFWALKDVSFEIRSGAVLGVIGRNGAGKSTLLKILSRITVPAEGRLEIHGRVGSLLEVGTGFHPELTGRENVFLNGAILGMRKADIARRFDEIVGFAEVDKFIDTPVKHYSSGMYLRLAFAVAAHLEPEILIVDEVLAVGDLQFQNKCLGKMGDVANDGRTVLLVSHQINQIRRLCTGCIWLDGGRVKQEGDANDVASAYEYANSEGTSIDGVGEGQAARTRFLSWAVDGTSSDDPTTLSDDASPAFRFQLRVLKPVTRGHHGIALFNSDNLLVWAHAVDNLAIAQGDHELRYRLQSLPLKPGIYRWQLSLYEEGTLIDLWNAVPPLRVHTRLNTHASDSWQGVLNVAATLTVNQKSGQQTDLGAALTC